MREGSAPKGGGNCAPQRPMAEHGPTWGCRGSLPGLQRAQPVNTAPQWSWSVPPAVLKGQGGAVDRTWGEPQISVPRLGGHWGHDRRWSGSGFCCPLGRGSESRMGPFPGLGGGGPASTWDKARLARERQDGAPPVPLLCGRQSHVPCALLPEPRTGSWSPRARRCLSPYFQTRICSRWPQSRKPEITRHTTL